MIDIIMFRVMMYSGMIGFLGNAVLYRLTEKVPMDDIMFPVALLLCMIILLLITLHPTTMK